MVGNICFHASPIDLFNSALRTVQLFREQDSRKDWWKAALQWIRNHLRRSCGRYGWTYWKPDRSSYRMWLVDHFAEYFIQVALVRMCADGAKPQAQRFGYNHAFDAILRIGREEGLRTFTRGLGPNIVRSVIMSMLVLMNIPQHG